MTVAKRLWIGIASGIASLAVALVGGPLAHAQPVPQPITEFTVTPVATPQMTAVGLDATQAGAHPDVNIYLRFCLADDQTGSFGCPAITTEQRTQLRDLIFRLPPGMLGNPLAVEPCTTHLWKANGCRETSKVGSALATAIPPLNNPTPVPSQIF